MKFLNMRNKSIKGFTLLEILVVISIIGILIAIGASAFSTAQKKSRDARRSGDLKAVQNAFEQYYVTNDSSYGSCDQMSAQLVSGSMLTDPKTGIAYSCTVDSLTPTKYCVCAELDNPGNGNASSTGLGGVCTYAANGDFFCVSSLQ